MGIPAVFLPPFAIDTPAGELSLAIWPCALTGPQYQRAGRYLPASTPARSDPANLAHASLPALLVAMGEILAGCAAVLRPGGLVVLTARPRRRRDLEQALGMLRAAMDVDRVWPDAWFISDHGNPHRINPGGD
jgi:hypothetical protein